MIHSALHPAPFATWPMDSEDAVPTTNSPAKNGDVCRRAEQVERVLRASGYWVLRSVDVTAHDQVVVLKGSVPNFYLKQLAQAVALTVPEVLELRNDLRVQSGIA